MAKLDTGATQTAKRVNPALEAMEKINRG